MISALALSGCHQTEINRIHTNLFAEQQVINRDGRAFEAENEVVDRWNREQLARLAQLER